MLKILKRNRFAICLILLLVTILFNIALALAQVWSGVVYIVTFCVSTGLACICLMLFLRDLSGMRRLHVELLSGMHEHYYAITVRHHHYPWHSRLVAEASSKESALATFRAASRINGFDLVQNSLESIDFLEYEEALRQTGEL